MRKMEKARTNENVYKLFVLIFYADDLTHYTVRERNKQTIAEAIGKTRKALTVEVSR